MRALKITHLDSSVYCKSQCQCWILHNFLPHCMFVCVCVFLHYRSDCKNSMLTMQTNLLEL